MFLPTFQGTLSWDWLECHQGKEHRFDSTVDFVEIFLRCFFSFFEKEYCVPLTNAKLMPFVFIQVWAAIQKVAQ